MKVTYPPAIVAFALLAHALLVSMVCAIGSNIVIDKTTHLCDQIQDLCLDETGSRNFVSVWYCKKSILDMCTLHQGVADDAMLARACLKAKFKVEKDATTSADNLKICAISAELCEGSQVVFRCDDMKRMSIITKRMLSDDEESSSSSSKDEKKKASKKGKISGGKKGKGKGGKNDVVCEEDTASVRGIVTSFVSKSPVSMAEVTIQFIESSGEELVIRTTLTNDAGFYTFKRISASGSFVLTATTTNDAGETGSAQGFVAIGQPQSTFDITVDIPGMSSLSGTITSSGTSVVSSNALVTLYFPETGRTASTTTDSNGQFSFTEIVPDGTVVVVAFDQVTAATASASTFLTTSISSQILNLQLIAPSVIQPELVNGGFAAGLEGWEVIGPAEIVPAVPLFLEPTLPPDGRRLQETCPITMNPSSGNAVVISTAGNSNSVGQISQTFIVPMGAKTLKGTILFLSDEWPTYFGSEFNDNYLVRLTAPIGTVILGSNNLNSESWSSGTLGYNGKSPPVDFSVSVAGFVGLAVSLHLEVRDVADQVVDSALALSNIRLLDENACDEDIEQCNENECELISNCKNPERDKCDFYLDCLEKGFDCGVGGYPTAFGNKFCNIFLDNEKEFSPSAFQWSSNVRLCLQNTLVDDLENRGEINCDELKSIAFASHVPCYLDTGVCNSLSMKDGLKLLRFMKSQLISLDFYIQFGGVVKGCLGQWGASFVGWVGEIVFAQSFDGLLDAAGGTIDALQEYLKQRFDGILTGEAFDYFFWDIKAGSTVVQLIVFDDPATNFSAEAFLLNLTMALQDNSELLSELGLDVLSVDLCNGPECFDALSPDPNIINTPKPVCAAFSGCDTGDSDMVAVCEGECSDFKTVCIESSEVESHLDKYPDSCGCCTITDEVNRPSYCDANSN